MLGKWKYHFDISKLFQNSISRLKMKIISSRGGARRFCTFPFLLNPTFFVIIYRIIIVMVVLYLFHTFFFESSYVWQVTTLASFIQPVSRSTCSLPMKSLPIGKMNLPISAVHNTNRSSNRGRHLRSEIENFSKSFSNTKQHNISNEQGKDYTPRIGILMLYENKDGNWGEDLMKRVIENRKKYASRYGYTIVTANDIIDHSRPSAWSKLKAMDHYLHQFDYLMYIDMDVVILNPTISLKYFISISPDSDFIMTEDWNGINSGNWIARNTPFAHWFLQKAWNQTQLIQAKSSDGKSHPFEYEQRAFHFLLNTDIWHERHLPTYRGDPSIEEIRKHFYVLPQCSMNSYIVYPYYWKGDREKAHLVEGDFLVHFAGKKGKIKTNLLHHYLSVAEKNYI